MHVDSRLNIPTHTEAFIIGDLTAALSHEPGGSTRPVPGVSPAAKQMGVYAAAHILAALHSHGTDQDQDQSLPAPFRYRDYGNLATIGRKAAVAHLGSMQLSGYFAWLFWLFVHIYFLIGFRNRLVVLMDWAWAYWSFQRYARVVAEPAPPPGATEVGPCRSGQ